MSSLRHSARRSNTIFSLPATAWFAFAVVLSFAVRWPFLGMPLTDDEGGYAYIAQRWLEGEGHLYRDLWVSRPQGILVVYALIFGTLGHGAEAIRLGAAFAAAATIGAVWLFAREWGGLKLAVPAALMFAVVSASPSLDGPIANAEIFMGLPAAYAAWLLLRTSRRGWSAKSLLAIGALTGCSTLLKPTGATLLPVCLAFIVMSTPSLNAAARRCVWTLAGFGAALAPAVVHGWLVGWHAFVFAVIRYRFQHQSSANLPAADQLKNIGLLLLFAAPFLIVSALVTLIRRPAGSPRFLSDMRKLAIVAPFGLSISDRRSHSANARLLLGLWIVGSLGGVALGGGWFPHYLVQAAAPFAIWFAAAAWRTAARLGGSERRRLIAAVALLSLLPAAVLPMLGSARADALLLGPGYNSQMQVAAYIRAHTTEQTSVYVAFAQPSIYYFADRPAAYRYLFDREVTGIPGVYDQLIAMVVGPNRPLYVIGSQRGNSFPDHGRQFWRAVAAHYHLETTIGAVPIYRANNSP